MTSSANVVDLKGTFFERTISRLSFVVIVLIFSEEEGGGPSRRRPDLYSNCLSYQAIEVYIPISQSANLTKAGFLACQVSMASGSQNRKHLFQSFCNKHLKK